MIISPSAFLRTQLMRKLPHSRIDVIVNGIDDAQPIEKGDDRGYLLFIGRLSREKGVATLAKAHQHMRHNIPLKIAGHGSLYDDLVARFPNAEFLGYM